MATDSQPEGTPKRVATGLGTWARFTSLGIQFALSIALPTALGYWLDTQAGTLPWLMVLMALLGTVAAIVLVIRATNPPQKPNP